LPPEHTHFVLTQFYNVERVKKTNSLILYFGQKWAPIEMNGKNCNLEHYKISQNKTPGDSKVTSSSGFSSKNLLE